MTIIESIFHIHRFRTMFQDGPKIVQECKCGKMRSTMYDMAYGGTYWVSGDVWLRERVLAKG